MNLPEISRRTIAVREVVNQVVGTIVTVWQSLQLILRWATGVVLLACLFLVSLVLLHLTRRLAARAIELIDTYLA